MCNDVVDRPPVAAYRGRMPILEVHLVDGLHSAEQHTALLMTMSARYAEVLESPIGRVRAYLTLHQPQHWATAGVPAAQQPGSAPYFTAIVLAGRPAEQRHRLLASFTDILVSVLGVDRGLVRGRIIQVDPDDWGIAGTPAAAARRDEIAERAAASRP